MCTGQPSAPYPQQRVAVDCNMSSGSAQQHHTHHSSLCHTACTTHATAHCVTLHAPHTPQLTVSHCMHHTRHSSLCHTACTTHATAHCVTLHAPHTPQLTVSYCMHHTSSVWRISTPTCILFTLAIH